MVLPPLQQDLRDQEGEVQRAVRQGDVGLNPVTVPDAETRSDGSTS